MRVIDLLKKLGVNVDENIEIKDDDASPATSGSKGESKLIVGDEKKKESNSTININLTSKKDDKQEEKQEDTGKKEEVKEMDFKTIKYDKDSGLFDLSNIENEDLKAILKISNDNVIEKGNSLKIESALNEKLSGMKIRKGITVDAVKSLINMENVKVGSDGKVVGLDEAITTLQTEQSGLFVSRTTPDSNPMLEGFHPASSGSVDNSIDSALAQMASAITANA